MAVANIAWILASRGKRVLVVDWDLEAPGLHRYFRPFLVDADLTSSDGVIDLAVEFATHAAQDRSNSQDTNTLKKANEDFLEDLSSSERIGVLQRYAVPLAWAFGDEGALDLLPAGRQGPAYAAKVNGFDWRTFYDRLGGGDFVDALRAEMRSTYDYTLIDSRTGVSDTSGICTIHLPDTLVICFTLNNQSIEGASSIAASVQRQRSGISEPSSLRLLPVPMRVQLGEKAKLETRRNLAVQVFGRFVDQPIQDNYFDHVEVPYDPYYAYEEVLATFADRPGGVSTVLAALERLTGYITKGEIDQLARPEAAERDRILGEFSAGYVVPALPEISTPVPQFKLGIRTRQARWKRVRWFLALILVFIVIALLPIWMKKTSRAPDRTSGTMSNKLGKIQFVESVVLSGHSDYVSSVVFSPDGSRVITGSRDNTVRSWDVATGRQLSVFESSSPVTAVAISSGGRLFIANSRGGLQSCSLGSLQCLALETGTRSAIVSLRAADNKIVGATSAGNLIISIDNGHTFRALRSLEGRSVAISPHFIAVIGADRQVLVLSESGTAEPIPIATDSFATALVFSPDERSLAVGTASGRVLLVDPNTSRSLNEFPKQDKSVTSVAFNPSGSLLMVSSLSSTVQLYSQSDATPAARISGSWGPVYDVAFSPDGDGVGAACADNTVRLFQIKKP